MVPTDVSQQPGNAGPESAANPEQPPHEVDAGALEDPASPSGASSPNSALTTSTDPLSEETRAAFREDMLRREIEHNATDPRFNPYWDVSNFTFRMNTSDPSAPYPDSMRYWYVTPEGIETCETDIFKMTL